MRLPARLGRRGAPLGLHAVPVLLVGHLMPVHLERRERDPQAVAHNGRAACGEFLRAGRHGLVPQPSVPDGGLGEQDDAAQRPGGHHRETE